MAATACSLAIATLALVWWLAATARGVPVSHNQHQHLQWMQQRPDDAFKVVRGNSANEIDRLLLRPDPWEQAVERLRASGLTPSVLKQLLREESNRWPAAPAPLKKPAVQGGGQREVSNDNAGANWKPTSLQHANKKRWLDLFGGSSVETRFPLPERRQFPEVDWRGFNEDVFHESFGDFNPMKRWKRRSTEV